MEKRYASLEEVRSRTFLGHPVGLWALFTTEMWERFCYYGMRALLVLYLIATLTDSNPGFGWSEKDANELYGWFTGLVYLFPLVCGYLADRFLGQHRSILLGGVLMAAGEFCLFCTEYFRQNAISTITPESAPSAFWCFMFGLFLITLGNGFFKPCISVMVGDLYAKGDPRRDDAFNIFYMGINVGAFLAPFIAGSIGEKISWHWGFLTACIGMVFGLCSYSWLRPKYLGTIGMKLQNSDVSQTSSKERDGEDSKSGGKKEVKVPLTRVEVDRIVVILTLTFFCIAFWSVFEQAGTSLNIFAKKETNRQVPTAIGQNFPGFLANQDELDAKITMNELKVNLVNLEKQIEVIKAKQKQETKKSDWEETFNLILANDFTSAREKLTVLSADTKDVDAQNVSVTFNEVEASYDNALFLINKVNEVRKQIGREPLPLPIDNLKQVLAEGKEAQNLLEAKVAALFEERKSEFESLDSGSIEHIRAGLEKDVRKSIQEEFLTSEKNNIDKSTAIYTFPTTWYQSVNPLAVVIFAPLFNLLWGFLRRFKMEPSTPVKFGVGLVLLSVAFLFMIGGALQSSKTNGNAGAYWLLCTYLFCTWGELCLSPVGLSMVTRLAPARYSSLLMGVWLFSSAVAGYLSGKLASVLGSSETGGAGRVAFCFGQAGGLADFFLIMTLVPLFAGVLVFLFSSKLRKMMHEQE